MLIGLSETRVNMLKLAVLCRRKNVVEMLLKKNIGNREDATLFAAFAGDLDMLLFLEKLKVKKSKNAIFWAAFNGREKCIEHMMKEYPSHGEATLKAA